MSDKKTVLLGASSNPDRYSNLALKQLQAKGYSVTAIGKRSGKVGNVEIETEKKTIENVDTVTLYLNASNQKEYYDYILSLHPKRIIFNPGSENEELSSIAEKNNIQTLDACTLVLLSTGQY